LKNARCPLKREGGSLKQERRKGGKTNSRFHLYRRIKKKKKKKKRKERKEEEKEPNRAAQKGQSRREGPPGNRRGGGERPVKNKGTPAKRSAPKTGNRRENRNKPPYLWVLPAGGNEETVIRGNQDIPSQSPISHQKTPAIGEQKAF